MLIPAIDIKGGQCVRLYKGQFEDAKIYYNRPEDALDFLMEKGYRHLHIVNLDATINKTNNLRPFIKKATASGCFIQYGGGIRSIKSLKEALALGVDKVIIGTLAVTHPQVLFDLPVALKAKIILGFDVIDETLMIKGWQEASHHNLFESIQKFKEQGFETYIVTDIKKDGTLKGPNLELYQKLLTRWPDLDLIASGGIKDREDLAALKRLGIKAAISGKAIYEAHIEEALC